jgi:sulfur-oxidizing protein SoxZ
MAEPMKIRATMEGDAANIKVLMNHVMETGQRKDAKTGQLIPAHFIQTVSAQVNGKVVLEAQWSQAVSKNPFLGFKVKGAKAGDKVTVSWADNKGEKNSADAVVA